jgi:hypothetical protein
MPNFPQFSVYSAVVKGSLSLSRVGNCEIRLPAPLQPYHCVCMCFCVFVYARV